MTAIHNNDGGSPPQESIAGAVVRHIEHVCQTAIDGRRAARALAEWTQRFALTEAEFQLLWRLRTGADAQFDQTTLASELAFSPAQVSATVERVRSRGWIEQQAASGDRRRHYWQLSAYGRSLLDEMLKSATGLRYEGLATNAPDLDGRLNREAA